MLKIHVSGIHFLVCLPYYIRSIRNVKLLRILGNYNVYKRAIPLIQICKFLLLLYIALFIHLNQIDHKHSKGRKTHNI